MVPYSALAVFGYVGLEIAFVEEHAGLRVGADYDETRVPRPVLEYALVGDIEYSWGLIEDAVDLEVERCVQPVFGLEHAAIGERNRPRIAIRSNDYEVLGVEWKHHVLDGLDILNCGDVGVEIETEFLVQQCDGVLHLTRY